MADELTVRTTLQYSDSEESEDGISPDEFRVDVGTKKFIHAKFAVGLTEEALFLGEVATPGYAIFANRDLTNFVEIRVGTAGAKMVKLKAGEKACFRFGTGATAPYAIADTAPVQLEYFIVND